ncbi:MAG TPA: ATP-binding protein [Candidatus Acidoferrales bacterium]|jgi:anti-sigma regulatory factor (Ser/Thr protein kinase)|nr:ATP-binding protein [Candidatus Acidoferrales bacterium]
MSLYGKQETKDRLILASRLSEISRVAGWVEALAAQYIISANIQLSINLCLEETLANVIRHGYGEGADRAVSVNFTMPREAFFVFTVEDEAPHFNPLAGPELSALHPDEEFRVGGQGIRFLRRFADLLEYEATPAGNRLRIGFTGAQTSAAAE